MTSEVKYTDFRLHLNSTLYENEVVFLSNDSVLLKYAVEEGGKELRLISCCVGCGTQLKYSFLPGETEKWGCISADGCGRISSVGTEIHPHEIRSSVCVWGLEEYSKVNTLAQVWVAKWLDVSITSVEVEFDHNPIIERLK